MVRRYLYHQLTAAESNGMLASRPPWSRPPATRRRSGATRARAHRRDLLPGLRGARIPRRRADLHRGTAISFSALEATPTASSHRPIPHQTALHVHPAARRAVRQAATSHSQASRLQPWGPKTHRRALARPLGKYDTGLPPADRLDPLSTRSPPKLGPKDAGRASMKGW